MSTQQTTAPTTSKVIHVINECIEACLDGQRGYHAAAAVALDPTLMSLFQSHAAVRAGFIRTLESVVVKQGGTPRHHGTVKGVAHRGFMELRIDLEGPTDAVILGECERGELEALAVYDRALTKGAWDLPSDVRTILVEHRGLIANAYEDLVARDIAERRTRTATPAKLSATEAELNRELAGALAGLEELADEVRVKLHLASMDARDRWTTTIEPHLFEARQHAKEATVKSKAAIDDARKALRAFADSL